MIDLIKTKIGRLRIIGFLEGISLLVLIFIAIPMKYYFDNPSLSKALGPVHGAIFLLFLLNTLSLGVEQNWKFKTTTWKVILACFIPFGTFYIDNKILSKIWSKEFKQF
jgi:integral membrane protein